MAQRILRIGTRDSQLAIWQAKLVQNLLNEGGLPSELIFIKSTGDLDTITPLYELGVQGIFTKSLDSALLNDRIDLAVHSMKDVPTKMAANITEAAVLKRASYKDVLVYKNEMDLESIGFLKGAWQSLGTMQKIKPSLTIGTSSMRRMFQWLHRYPHHRMENLRGNINTRIKKVENPHWNGALFAAAGLERISLRPSKALDLDWMLPAPAQGAIMVVCRTNDFSTLRCCQPLNDPHTALCTKIERDFLKALMGGCSAPISGLAQLKNQDIYFRGNIATINGAELIDIQMKCPIDEADQLGKRAAAEILLKGGQVIVQNMRNKLFS
ncbi:MAG: hydroxymethylbilane synthase [Flavisolibacter sp.]